MSKRHLIILNLFTLKIIWYLYVSYSAGSVLSHLRQITRWDTSLQRRWMRGHWLWPEPFGCWATSSTDWKS